MDKKNEKNTSYLTSKDLEEFAIMKEEMKQMKKILKEKLGVEINVFG